MLTGAAAAAPADNSKVLADIRAELRATGYLRQPRNAKKEKTAQRAPLSGEGGYGAYRVFHQV